MTNKRPDDTPHTSSFFTNAPGPEAAGPRDVNAAFLASLANSLVADPVVVEVRAPTRLPRLRRFVAPDKAD